MVIIVIFVIMLIIVVMVTTVIMVNIAIIEIIVIIVIIMIKQIAEWFAGWKAYLGLCLHLIYLIYKITHYWSFNLCFLSDGFFLTKFSRRPVYLFYPPENEWRWEMLAERFKLKTHWFLSLELEVERQIDLKVMITEQGK